MRTIFELCEPRSEVLEGELREDIFAARLRDVIDGKADPVYGKAATFFDNTYPTMGLRHLLTEALGRLTATKPGSCPIIRLETAFGGGKTHNLIALYHACRSGVAPSTIGRLVDPALLPAEPLEMVAGVVGSDMEPAAGFLHDDTGIKTYTIGGEIAHQIGGAAGYEIVREADEGKNAIGTRSFERLIGDGPCLIMLDELGRFLRDASSVPTPGNKKINLAETTIPTLMSLLEFASSKERVVVVLTLADSSDAFGRESDEMRRELGEARKVSARQERVITPSSEAEMPAIVSHRLFKKIDREGARETVAVYASYYESIRDREPDFCLPDQVFRAEYQEEMLKDYPFHPSFLRTLRRKTSTIPSFQQTRGALRLLARTIRALWRKKKEATYLLHIHNLDFSLDDVANDLTSRLERPLFRQVIEADLVSPRKGSRAHAQDLDEDRVASGKPAYAYRLASTIFVNSLTQGVASGMDANELAEAVLVPDDEPATLKRVLEDLERKCWFLDYDGDRFRFKTEPSLNKLIADEAASIPTTRAKRELVDRIQGVWKGGVFKPLYFKSEASEVDDDATSPKLVVIHFDAATARETDEHQKAPELVLQIFERSGSMEGYRRFKNNVLFLVADKDHAETMVNQMREYLAVQRIVADGSRMAEFTRDQQDKLRKACDAAELKVRVAITRSYRFLYYPSEDAPKKCQGLRRYTLPAQDQGEVRKDQSQVVLRVLKSLGKVLTSEDSTKAAAWLKARAWPLNKPHVSTEALRREFARRIGLPILLDTNQLKNTIKYGIRNGDWIYYVAEEQVGYGKASPAPLITFSDDNELYEVEEARRQGFAIKGEEKRDVRVCPLCGKETCECVPEQPEDELRPADLSAEGAPSEALQKIVDLCSDKGIATLKSLRISVEGSGASGEAELRSIGLAIPQMGKGNYHIEQSFACEFGEDESITLTFKGSWGRYKRLKQVTEGMAKEGKRLTVRTTLTVSFDSGLEVAGPQFETIHEVLSGLSFGKLFVTAEPGDHGAKEKRA